jgi:uncharacterized protein with GYD domain
VEPWLSITGYSKTVDAEARMPKYLVQAITTTEGARGFLKEGGTSRRAAVEKLVNALGGTLEAFYYAFGEADEYIIADLPDNVSMAAAAVVATAGGASALKTAVLITPEEMDAAVKKTPSYRPPGQ